MSVDMNTIQTLDAIEAVLKTFYGPALINDLNNMTVTYSLIKKDSEEVEVAGEDLGVWDPMKLGHNIGGVKSSGEGDALPAAKKVRTKRMATYLKFHYGCVEITGQAIAASRRNATAFIKGIQLEMDGMVESVSIYTNRMVLGNGSGTLCRVNGAYDAAADPRMVVDTPGTRWLREGMVICSDGTYGVGVPGAGNLSNGLTQATAHTVGRVVSATEFDVYDYTGTILAGGGTGITAADDDFLHVYENEDNEMMGLLGLIDSYQANQEGSYWMGDSDYFTQTIQTLDRSLYPIADAVIGHNSGTNRPLTDRLIQRQLDTMEIAARRQNRPINELVMLCRHEIREAWMAELSADRRYSPNTLELIGGWSALGYRNGNVEVPFVVEQDMIDNAILFLDLGVLRIYRDEDWHWHQFGRSGIWQQKIDSGGKYDAYEAWMATYQNLGTKSFRRLGALRDVTA